MPAPEERPPILRLTWTMVGTFLLLELLFTGVLIGFMVFFCTERSGHAAEPDTSVAAVNSMLQQQVADWNKGDLDGFMRGYWNDEALSFFSGATATKGWQATMNRYQKRYKSEGKAMGNLQFSEVAVEPLNATTALVRGRWKLTMKDGTTPNGLFTLLLRRIDGQWRIVHDHTSSA